MALSRNLSNRNCGAADTNQHAALWADGLVININTGNSNRTQIGGLGFELSECDLPAFLSSFS